MTIQSNRVTVIVELGQVYLDEGVVMDLDFSECGIPSDVHALQFRNGKGEVEYTDTRPNLQVTEVPDWGVKCVELFMASKAANPDSVHRY